MFLMVFCEACLRICHVCTHSLGADFPEKPDWAKSGAGDTTTNEDDEEAPVNLGAQHVLMVVDCHQDMFVPVNDDVCSADLALTLAQQLLQQRIRDTVTLKIGKRNGVGVLLFDTKPMESHSEQVEELSDDDDDDHDNDDNNEESPTRSVHVLIPLDPPGIRQVQTIRSCLKRERNLQKEFSQSRDADPPRIAPLQIALEEAVRIFRQAKCVREKASKPNEPLDARTIWILTNRDNPYPPLAQQLLQNVARDAKDAGIQILVWPLAHPETNEFVMEPLYGEVVSRDVFEGRRLKTQQEIEEGLEELQQYWKKIRRLYWGPLLFPRQPQPSEEDTPEIMVDWFRFVQLAKKPTKVQIDQRTKRYVSIAIL